MPEPQPRRRTNRRATSVVALSTMLVCTATATAWAVNRPSDRVEAAAVSTPVAAAPSARSTAAPVTGASPKKTRTASTKVRAEAAAGAKAKAKAKAAAEAKTSAGAAATAGAGAAATAEAAPTATVAPTSSGAPVGEGARSAIPAGRLFAADSPWNVPIPESAALDPQSAAISKAVLTNQRLVVNVAIYAYGIPFYTATAATPRVVLNGRGSTGARIPLDPSWAPNEGGDRKMNVIDPATHSVYELQYYDQVGRSAYWMVQRDTATGMGDGTASAGRRGPTGSGMTQAGGVIRISELKAGRIDHALSFITSAPVAGRFRYPATSSDGTSTASVGMEEGMRVQLDPALDLRSLGLSRAEYAIARALQRYGAYCVDNGGGNNQAMGFYAESPTRSTGDPYASLGLVGDWAQLKGIPRSAYRVLAASVTQR